MWPLLHANSFGEPLVRAGCQVGTKADELLQGAPRVPPSEVLPLPDTPDTPSSITIHLKSLHWLPVKVKSTYKIACLCYHCHSSTARSYVTGMLHKSHCTPATLAPAHTPCLFSIDLHTVRQHLVIVHFLLLLLLSGTPFQMMSVVPHHCHHLCLV